jgi:hypothetical protein
LQIRKPHWLLPPGASTLSAAFPERAVRPAALLAPKISRPRCRGRFQIPGFSVRFFTALVLACGLMALGDSALAQSWQGDAPPARPVATFAGPIYGLGMAPTTPRTAFGDQQQPVLILDGPGANPGIAAGGLSSIGGSVYPASTSSLPSGTNSTSIYQPGQQFQLADSARTLPLGSPTNSTPASSLASPLGSPLANNTICPPSLQHGSGMAECIDHSCDPWEWQILPQGLIWHSYLAGPKEPRLSGVVTSDTGIDTNNLLTMRYGVQTARRGWLEKSQATMRAAALSMAILLGVLAGRSRAEEPAARNDRFELSLTTEVGIPRGYVEVRENDIQGTHLSFHSDLGIDTIERVTGGAAYRLSDVSRLRLAFDTIFLYGTERLDSDVLFNGATLQGGTDLESRPEFFRLTALYERRLLDFAQGAGIGGDIGLTYVFLTYKMHGTLSPTSQGGGGETVARASAIGSQVSGGSASPGGTPATVKEDFLTQELPIPMLGVTFDYPLKQRWSFVGSVLGGYLPRVDSLRTEEGRFTSRRATSTCRPSCAIS